MIRSSRGRGRFKVVTELLSQSRLVFALELHVPQATITLS